MIIALLIFYLSTLPPSDDRSWDLRGYVEEMPSVASYDPRQATQWNNTIHNRMNFRWDAAPGWRLHVGARNRVIAGSSLADRAFADAVGFDRGWADLSWNLIEMREVLFNVNLDRLFVSFERGRWTLDAGRQRVEWGRAAVWNPNDILNTWSAMQFDYPERPGTDAIRVTLSHGRGHRSEAAAGIDHWGKVTAALLHRHEAQTLDWQVLAGVMNSADAVAGGAFTLRRGRADVRCEGSLFRSVEHFADSAARVSLSFGGGFTASRSLWIRAEALYNDGGSTLREGGLKALYLAPPSAAALSPSEWSFYAGAGVPLGSRLRTTLSGIYYPDVRTWYSSLDATCDLSRKVTLSATGQYFTGDYEQGAHARAVMGFLKVKYSF